MKIKNRIVRIIELSAQQEKRLRNHLPIVLFDGYINNWILQGNTFWFNGYEYARLYRYE